MAKIMEITLNQTSTSPEIVIKPRDNPGISEQELIFLTPKCYIERERFTKESLLRNQGDLTVFDSVGQGISE